MKKIIIPIDFSEHSEYALELASNLSKKFGSELLVLHMLELSNMMYSSAAIERHEETVFYLKLAEKKFEKFLKKSYLKGIKVTPVIKHFKVFSEVNAIAKANDASLVIMGSHGSSGFKELIIGSNTEKVIRHSDIPVMVVKNKVNEINFSKMVLITNFDKEMTNAFIQAKSMATLFNSNLKLLYVNTPTDRFLSSTELDSKMSKFFDNVEWHTDRKDDVVCVSDYTIEQGVISYIKEHQTNLIIIPTHGRKGLNHFFSGSIAEDIVNHSNNLIMSLKI